MTIATIESNIASIMKVISNSLTTARPEDRRKINNADWLRSINYHEFLRDFGPYFSVNLMLSFDSVKTRSRRAFPCRSSNSILILQPTTSSNSASSRCRRRRVAPTCGATRQRHRPRHRMGTPQLNALTSRCSRPLPGLIWQVRDRTRLAQRGHVVGLDVWQYWRKPKMRTFRASEAQHHLPMSEVGRLSARRSETTR